MDRRIYSFSVRVKDINTVEKFKTYCEDNDLNFSAVIVKLIKNYLGEPINGKQNKRNDYKWQVFTRN